MRRGIIVAGLLITLTIIYIFTYQSRPRGRKAGPKVGIDKTFANDEGEAEAIKRLPIDIPGGQDLKGVGRPPQSTIVWQQRSKLLGLSSKTVKYKTLSSPEELQRYFTDKLADQYAIIRDDQASDSGLGWSGLFLNPETDELIAIFSTARRLDLPPGGEKNPALVSVMKVNGFADDKR